MGNGAIDAVPHPRDRVPEPLSADSDIGQRREQAVDHNRPLVAEIRQEPGDLGGMEMAELGVLVRNAQGIRDAEKKPAIPRARVSFENHEAAAGDEHAVHLADPRRRIRHVMQNAARDDGIEAAVAIGEGLARSQSDRRGVRVVSRDPRRPESDVDSVNALERPRLAECVDQEIADAAAHFEQAPAATSRLQQQPVLPAQHATERVPVPESGEAVPGVEIGPPTFFGDAFDDSPF